MKCYYWAKNELTVLYDDIEIRITPDTITVEIEGEYYGPSLYIMEIGMYDLCGLIALLAEYMEDDEG